MRKRAHRSHIPLGCGSRRGHFLAFLCWLSFTVRGQRGNPLWGFGAGRAAGHKSDMVPLARQTWIPHYKWGRWLFLPGALLNPGLSLPRSWGWLLSSQKSLSVYSHSVPWAARQRVVSNNKTVPTALQSWRKCLAWEIISSCQLWDDHFLHQKHTENVGF